MKVKFFAFIAIISIVLAGCSFGNDENSAQNEMDPQNIKELVHDLSVGNIESLSASITSHQLIVKDKEEKEVIYDLSDNEFFVSIAPYINQTHP